MTRTIPKPADRDEWLTARHPYIGGSDAATLLDANPYNTPTGLAIEKMRPTPQPIPDNTAMRRGRHLEAAVAGWYAENVGRELYEPDVLYIDRDGDIAVTLDRRYRDDPTTAVEIKTSAKPLAEPPIQYVWQCQAQAAAADLAAVDLVAFDSSFQLTTWRINRDDDMIGQLREHARAFLEPIRRGEWPAHIPTTEQKAERPSGLTIALDDNTATLVEDLDVLREQIRTLKTDEDLTRRAIIRRLGDATVGEHEGRVIVRNAWTSRRHIDAARLRADHPDIAAQYEKASSYPTLRVVR